MEAWAWVAWGLAWATFGAVSYVETMRRRRAELRLVASWELRQAMLLKLHRAERAAEVEQARAVRLEGIVESLRCRLSGVGRRAAERPS